MTKGILVLGLNGCGKTTIGRALARRLNLFRMDAEDYYFPTPGDYSLSRTEEEAHRLMDDDVACHGDFVLSCVRCNVSDDLLARVRLAIVLKASTEIRLSRIVQRELDRFGSRVLPGGDMYKSQQAFRAFAAGRSEDIVTESLKRLSCPVLEIDATLAVDEIANKICSAWLLIA